MSKDTKTINLEVPKPIWTKLKMLSIYHDKSLQQIVNELIDKSLNNKKVESIIGVDVS